MSISIFSLVVLAGGAVVLLLLAGLVGVAYMLVRTMKKRDEQLS